MGSWILSLNKIWIICNICSLSIEICNKKIDLQYRFSPITTSKAPILKKYLTSKITQPYLLVTVKSPETETKAKEEIKNGISTKYEAIKADIDIEYSQKMGRYARAKSDIRAGDIVLVETPHCALLLDTYRKTHCHNCFRR